MHHMPKPITAALNFLPPYGKIWVCFKTSYCTTHWKELSQFINCFLQLFTVLSFMSTYGHLLSATHWEMSNRSHLLADWIQPCPKFILLRNPGQLIQLEYLHATCIMSSKPAGVWKKVWQCHYFLSCMHRKYMCVQSL